LSAWSVVVSAKNCQENSPVPDSFLVPGIGEVGAGQWWQVGNPSCGNNLPDEQAVIYTGPVDFKIYIKNELQGTSKTLFTGKMNVRKVHVTTVDSDAEADRRLSRDGQWLSELAGVQRKIRAVT
jgi:hypothetical protein